MRLRYRAGPFALLAAWKALRSWSLAPLRDPGAVKLIARSGLFDPSWYIARNPDVAAWGIDPIRHYVAHGAREGRDPSPLFDTRKYLAQHPGPEARRNPLLHCLIHPSATMGCRMETAGDLRSDGTLNREAETAHAPVQADFKRRFRDEASAALMEFLNSRHRLVLPTCERPDVSIVLVLFNQAELTLACLRTLAKAMSIPSEVIIVDNASSDRTLDVCTRVDGARIIRNAENHNFLYGVNQAAAVSRGKAVLLLNNDTRVEPGSIAAAYARLQEESDVGAVGGKIVLLDGTLQEAGSIIWSDGSCAGYGRGKWPSEPEFQFRRDVDYCSAVFLLVRRSLFERLNWLDDTFAPAYYEDTDLCMRIRQTGLRVVYDPEVEISHFEFASAESSSQAIALQQRHKPIFYQRYAVTLKKLHFAPGTPPLYARMTGRHAGRILVIDDQVPYRTLGGGCPRARSLLAAIHEAGWFITLYPLMFPNVSWDEAYRLLPRDIEIMADHGCAALPFFLASRAGYYDAVLVSRPHNMSKFKQAITNNSQFLASTKLIYDAEAIFSAREALRQKLTGAPFSEIEFHKMLTKEMALAKNSNIVFAVNAAEAEIFRRSADADVQVLGHAVTPEPEPTAFRDRSDILFVGPLDDDVSPNVDSLVWFVREIMPLLELHLGAGFRLNVIGRNVSSMVRSLAGPRVCFHGAVADLRQFYARSRIFIAPTRYAAGVPMKVHEAAAAGLPVVATTLLSKQLDWSHGNELLAADTAEEFALACYRLYSDASIWYHLRTNALNRVRQDCDPAAFSLRVASVLRTLRFECLPSKDGAPSE